MVKCLPAMQETWVRSLGGEDTSVADLLGSGSRLSAFKAASVKCK